MIKLVAGLATIKGIGTLVQTLKDFEVGEEIVEGYEGLVEYEGLVAMSG